MADNEDVEPCSLLKLSIQGIRSFSPSRAETLEFDNPVTLIVGSNGSGKTTTIEALKAATCGQLPPNSDSGQGFVADPLLLGLSEVKAQIWLSFVSYLGQPSCVIRSFHSTVSRKTQGAAKTNKAEGEIKVAFRAVDSALKIRDKLSGEETTVTKRGGDMDAAVTSMLGLPKSLIDDVIFCHQEDSLWPVSDRASLKKRFDEIFSCLKYTKAMEALEKMRKEQAKQVTSDRESIGLLSRDFTHKGEIAAELAQSELKKKALESELCELKRLLVVLQSRLTELESEKNAHGSVIAQNEALSRAAEIQRKRLWLENRKALVGAWQIAQLKLAEAQGAAATSRSVPEVEELLARLNASLCDSTRLLAACATIREYSVKEAQQGETATGTGPDLTAAQAIGSTADYATFYQLAVSYVQATMSCVLCNRTFADSASIANFRSMVESRLAACRSNTVANDRLQCSSWSDVADCVQSIEALVRSRFSNTDQKGISLGSESTSQQLIRDEIQRLNSELEQSRRLQNQVLLAKNQLDAVQQKMDSENVLSEVSSLEAELGAYVSIDEGSGSLGSFGSASFGNSTSLDDLETFILATKADIGNNEKEIAFKSGSLRVIDQQLVVLRSKLAEQRFADLEVRLAAARASVDASEKVAHDLALYRGALGKALVDFHAEKLEEINEILGSLWTAVYKGDDIDYICIKSSGDVARTASLESKTDALPAAKRSRVNNKVVINENKLAMNENKLAMKENRNTLNTYGSSIVPSGFNGTGGSAALDLLADDAPLPGSLFSYGLIMGKKGGIECEMRGRCSAGQKVLASILVRLAIASAFSSSGSVLALDEPTTNLDRANVVALAEALSVIASNRLISQLIIITHDESFVKLLSRSGLCEFFNRVQKGDDGFSRISKHHIRELA